MRLSILEGLEEGSVLLEEDGGGVVADVSGPPGTTTTDVATFPQYLGFSYRGGTVRLHNKKRKKHKKKSHLEEALSAVVGSILEEYSGALSKIPDLTRIDDV